MKKIIDMRKQVTRTLFVLAVSMVAVVSANAQGLGGHSHTTTSKDPKRGDNWEIFHFPKVDRNTGEPMQEGGQYVVYDRSYYTGGHFDNLVVEPFLGGHWKGQKIDNIASNEEIYLCNVKTGEYLQVGDYWGENSMTNHTGISYTLDSEGAIYGRRTWSEFVEQDKDGMTGYWICPVLTNSSKEGRCIGRMHKNDGIQGHFEHNRYLALRDKNEYEGSTDPGGFVFQFYPVTTTEGKQAYIIYTHRQTRAAMDDAAEEYWNRDSYLLLQSKERDVTGYHTVRFRKFAGQMYGKPGAYPAIEAWGTNKDKPLGDEKDFVDDNGTPKTGELGSLVDANKRVARLAGLAAAAKDDANLWKIVTKAERDRLRLVASEDQPANITYRLKNPKFYTSYTYTRTLKETSSNPEDVVPGDWDADNNHYMHANGERDFGWSWFDVDRETHFTNHHIHPWNQHKVGGPSGGNWNPGWFDPEALVDGKPRTREFHKVGTGLYYRFNTPDVDAYQDEMMITYGLESNYVGSIWKGTTNLQQTIGTGKPGDPPLREGLYVVAVKGFYAPHDMMKYHKSTVGGVETYSRYRADFTATENTATQMGTGWEWYKEAVVTTEGPDKGKWKRSHDSYLFAWSYPDPIPESQKRAATAEDVENGLAKEVGDKVILVEPEEVRRMLPSIYEGAVLWDELSANEKKQLSKAYLLEPDNEDFLYTEVGYGLRGGRPGNPASWEPPTRALKDENNIAIYNGNHFSSGRYSGWNFGSGNWAVPKSLIGAGHWFNSAEGVGEESSSSFKNLSAYRIALPVYVGPEGILTIGVDHTLVNKELDYTYQPTDADGNPEGDPVTIKLPKSNPDEWVCFDDFELIYLGKVEPDEFVVDERHGHSAYKVASRTKTNGETGEEDPSLGVSNDGEAISNKNNTQWHDIFSTSDIVLNGREATTVKTVVVRRTLKKGGYSSIVLPISLTKAQVKEGFGENVRVSKLNGLSDGGRTIIYEALQDKVDDNDVLMEAGVPYIINPSKDPEVPAPTKIIDPSTNEVTYKVEVTYDRPAFTKAYSASADGIAGYYLRDADRNYEVEIKMEGPIYLINEVEIHSTEAFPKVEMQETTPGSGTYERISKGNTQDLIDNATWRDIDAFDSWEKKGKTYTIHRPELKDKKYVVKETAKYYAGETIPAYSYLWADGKLYYTSTPLPTSRGLYSYLQMVEVNPETNVPTGAVYSKPFIGGEDYFVENIEDPEVTGIEDINNPLPNPDGNMEIYDLMGRKVNNPRPGVIYIMNGVKVLWK